MTATVLAMAGAFSAALPAGAGETDVTARKREVGDRLVTAGRQRMLAQGMAATLCLADAGVAPDGSIAELYVMRNIFGWSHESMMWGNGNLNVSPEADGRVKRAWHELNAEWKPLEELYDAVLQGGRLTAGEFDRAIAMTGTVTDRATDVVTALRSAYSGDLGMRGVGAALLIDLYERQRMLGHMIAKDVCLVSRGDLSPARLASLEGTLDIFNQSLWAFVNGRPDVGVPPPATPEIAEALHAASEHWNAVTAFAAATARGRRPEQAELASFAASMDRVASAMTVAINGLVSFQENQPG